MTHLGAVGVFVPMDHLPLLGVCCFVAHLSSVGVLSTLDHLNNMDVLCHVNHFEMLGVFRFLAHFFFLAQVQPFQLANGLVFVMRS